MTQTPIPPQAITEILLQPQLFSELVLKMPLRPYQIETIIPITESVLRKLGREFLIVMPRQSGKNEAIAHMLVYLLNVLQRIGGNIIYGGLGDQVGRGIDRLEARLDNPWNRKKWKKKSKPTRRTIGKANIVFMSTHPMAATRGETAHHLLVIDEMQTQLAVHIEAVFTPMRAAHNASAVYIGTVSSKNDALWLKKQELEALQNQDGIQRVFFISPDEVTRHNPNYATFLAQQIAEKGRNHPIIRSEYFLEPVDGEGNLFDSRRRALFFGDHPQQAKPDPNTTYIATLDIAGQDETPTDLDQLTNPMRDYTVATIWEIIPPHNSNAPTYRAVNLFLDHGTRHFEESPGNSPLALRLRAYLHYWNVAHLVSDASGVGEGLTSWLNQHALPGKVTGFKFTSRSKAWLGSSFISLIETRRAQYWRSEEYQDDSWWMEQQMKRCAYHLPPRGHFDTHLRWYVPQNDLTETPLGNIPTHDDRLLSAALIAEADRLVIEGTITTGTAISEIIPPDPLKDLTF